MSVSRPRCLQRPLHRAVHAALMGLALVAVFEPAHTAHAATAAREETLRTYDIAPGPLGRALSSVAVGADIALSFDPALTEGLTSPALTGSYSGRDALLRLLEGSGLEIVPRSDGSYTLRKLPPAATNAHTLRPLRVTTTDVVDPTTEGSRSYTSRAITIAGGAHALRETPQSVSVVTRQRMDDQNMTTIEDAMKYTTGMKVTNYGYGGSAAVESRGYTIDHYAVDGVSSSARVYEGNFNLAMYDRLEVWRGPAGLLQGSGEPSGTINLVRKRAQGEFGLSAKLSAGSWDYYQGTVDVTGPLNDDASLRGRLVVAYEDRGYYVDHAWSRSPMVYGTLEYDFTPDTTLSLGLTAQRSLSRPFFGLSAYEDGSYPDISRSTFLGTDWNRQDQRSTRSFVELEHRLADGGSAKLTASYLDRSEHAAFEWGNGFIDPLTGDVPMVPYFSKSYVKEVNIDGQLVLPVSWRGLDQEFLIGANYQRFTTDSAYNGTSWGQNGFDLNTFHPDIHVPKPDVAIDPLDHDVQTQGALYGQARIKPWQPVTLVAGARLSWFRNHQQYALTPEYDYQERTNAKLVPYVGIVGEISRDFSLYGSYSNIFAPQNAQRFDGSFLAPRHGNQYEVGIKGSHFDQRLNTSLALYRIEDANRAMTDPLHPDFSLAAGKVRSEGVEAEVSGALTDHWNLTAGYGYNTTKVLKDSPETEGRPFTTTFPKNSFSLWTDYRFDNGLGIGGGVRYSGSIYNDSDGVRWGEGGYSVYSAQMNYQLTPELKGSVTINNLFDKRYLDRPEGWSRQNYYGDPRNVMFTLLYSLKPAPGRL